MNLLFIADPVEHFKIYKDTTFAMMREAQRRGHALAVSEPRHMHWQRGGRVVARVRDITLTGHAQDWFIAGEPREVALAEYDAVLMRKDPPFDSEYFYATHLLEQAERDGARVFNKPRALRDHSEKLAIMDFPDFAPPTVVSREAVQIHHFIDEQRDVILKPLDGMGGSQIFRVHRHDPNRNVIVETLTLDGTRTIMAQRYLPEISAGDKRILLIAGKVVPWCLARIPRAGETRGSLAAGGTGVAQELSPRDREIAETLAPQLLKRGLLLVGLDVIGDYLTGINVSHPGGMVELRQQSGFDAAGATISAIERVCGLT